MSEHATEKNAWIYAILLWFLGVFGVHKFYLNKTGIGVLYLFTGGLFSIGVIIDFISLIFISVKDRNGNVLQGAKSLKIISLIILVLIFIVVYNLISLL